MPSSPPQVAIASSVSAVVLTSCNAVILINAHRWLLRCAYKGEWLHEWSQDPQLSDGLSYYAWRVFVGMSYFPVERGGEGTQLLNSSQREVSVLDSPHRKFIPLTTPDSY